MARARRRGERESGDGIVARVLAGRDGAPALEVLEALPAGEARGAPLLLVHGAFGGAWMWREVFMPVFAAAGRRVVAFSIRGHGESEGYDRLRETSLTDYVADVRRALADVGEPPVVVAHSLGGLLAQMLIGREAMRALVLAASLPPEGMIFTTPRLAMTDPAIFTEAFLGSVTKTHGPIAMAGFQVLFSDGLPPHEIARHARRMQPESPRALLDAHASPPVLSALAFGIPTLVIGGERDRLVWRASTVRTALYHAAEHRTAEGMGHFVQLDVGAEELARDILAWIERQGV
jgi:pimeloyl-ACP methyl ester carboxylesterase